MTKSVQFDLFGDRPQFDPPSKAASPPGVLPEDLSDERLIAAIPQATLGDARALAAEAGRRRMNAAVPALASLCRRFVGFGAEVEVPEQAAALEALGVIGGHEASRALVELIVKGIVQGPTLAKAIAAAAELGVVLPTGTALALLRDPNPSVRAPACACVRAGNDVVGALTAMLDDPEEQASIAAACALGRLGRVAARAPLKRLLTERPSARVVEALACVADDDAIVLLARAGRARPELALCVVAALEDVDTPRAAAAALGLKRAISNLNANDP